MANHDIEPGVLRLFRWFVAIRLTLLFLALAAIRRGGDPTAPEYPLPGLIESAVLLALLVAPVAQRRLGRLFLPLTLSIASIAPIFESAWAVGVRLDQGASVNESLVDYWQLFFVLFVPLILIAWQYRYRAVVLFSVGTTVLDLALTIPQLQSRNLELPALGAIALGRGLLFAFVGIFVVKLVAAQKDARKVLARHAVMAEELATSNERNRLARELHDTLAHSLSGLAVQLEGVRSLWESDPEAARRMLDSSLENARDGLRESRRAISALRATPLEELGLVEALRHLAAVSASRNGLEVTSELAEVGDDVSPDVEQAIYRIADEALVNVTRHSAATVASVVLDRSGDTLRLTVTDDGSGFDVAAAPPEGHVGLAGMRERAAIVGGSLEVTSDSGGTVVRFDVEARP